MLLYGPLYHLRQKSLWSMQFSGIGFSYPVKYKTILKLTKKIVRVFRFVARSKVLQPFFQLLRKTDHPIYCAHSLLRGHAYRVYNFGLKFINGVSSLQHWYRGVSSYLKLGGGGSNSNACGGAFYSAQNWGNCSPVTPLW